MTFLSENYRGPTKVFLCIILIAVCMVRITTSGKKVRSLSESILYDKSETHINTNDDTKMDIPIYTENETQIVGEETFAPHEIFEKRKSILKRGCSQLQKIQGIAQFLMNLYSLLEYNTYIQSSVPIGNKI